MARMQSVQSQCCCCSMSVFSALFGIIMLSTGICLVLNYRIMEVDTTGLPPEWQNEDGKKIVGIILICCGLAGMGLSSLVTALYFTVCSKAKTTTSVMPSEPVSVEKPHNHSSHHPSSDRHSTVSNSHPSHSKQHSSRHGKRHKKKRPPPPLKGYKTRLAPHQEVVNENEARHEHMDLDESSRSLDSSNTSSSKTNSYHGDRRLDSQEVMETSLVTDSKSPFVITTPETSTDYTCKKVLFKTDSTGVSDSSHNPQSLLKLNAGDLAQGGSVSKSALGDYSAQTDSQVNLRRNPVLSNDIKEPLVYKNSSELPMLKNLPPPPIPATSLAADSDEDISQIEEIKQLDKDVANLLV